MATFRNAKCKKCGAPTVTVAHVKPLCSKCADDEIFEALRTGNVRR